jgi:hypothetical protein
MIRGSQKTESKTVFTFTQKQIADGICEDLQKQGFTNLSKTWNESNTKLTIEGTAVSEPNKKGGK